jgi:4-amino-4-deoxy-L-arabinose transferase-like glycosyltransferase
VFRRDPAVPKGSPLNYLTIFALILPWSAFFIAGLALAIDQLRQRPLAPITAALFLVVIPILVMIFFPDRKERYLLPMLSAAAILVAHGILAMREPVLRNRMIPVIVGHWMILLAVGVLLPIAAALPRISGMKTSDGGPWFSWPLAIGAAIVCGALIAGGIRLSRDRTAPLVVVTVAIILLIQPLLIWGYGRSDAGQSDFKPFAFELRQRFGNVPAYSFRPDRRPPEDLSIYMNRTVHMIKNIESVPPSNGPQLLFVFEHKSQPAPTVPQNWSRVRSQQRGEGTWVVYHHP